MKYFVQLFFKENVVVNYDIPSSTLEEAALTGNQLVNELENAAKKNKLYKIADGNWVNPSNLLAMRLMIKEEEKVVEPIETELENV